MAEVVISTQIGTAPNRRDCFYTYNFNQMRIHENREEALSTTFLPSYSSQIFQIRTDNDDFYSTEKEYDQDLVEKIGDNWAITVKGVNKFETFEQNLANVADNTWVTLYTFIAVDTSGLMVLKYSYMTQESGSDAGGIYIPIGQGFNIGAGVIIGVLSFISIAIILIKKRKETNLHQYFFSYSIR